MFTSAILILSLGQCGYEPLYRPCHTAGPWWFVAWQTGSPWNAAVAEMRARGPSRSRDLVLPTSTYNRLRELDLRRAEVYVALIAAPKAQKAELRQQLLVARQELERARMLAAKELYRGSGRN